MSSLEFRLDNHGPIYTPGETISGEIVLRANEKIKSNGLHVTLRGICNTSARTDGTETNRTREDSCSSHYQTESTIFLQLQNEIEPSKSYPAGTFSHKFSFRIPEICSAPKLGPQWSIPLPSTIQDVTELGSINYNLRATLAKSALLSFNLHVDRDIRIVSQSSTQVAFHRNKFVQQKLHAKVFDYDSDSWLLWTQRFAGLDIHTDTFPFQVKLTHSAAGLPAIDVPLSDVVSLKVFRLPKEAKKSVAFEISQIKATIRYAVQSNAINTTQQSINDVVLYENDSLRELLEFNEPSGDELPAINITHLLKDARLNTNFVTEKVPNLTVSAVLQVNVGIQPTLGNPIRPTFAGLESSVLFYNAIDQQLPDAARGLDSELPPYQE